MQSFWFCIAGVPMMVLTVGGGGRLATVGWLYSLLLLLLLLFVVVYVYVFTIMRCCWSRHGSIVGGMYGQRETASRISDFYSTIPKQMSNNLII